MAILLVLRNSYFLLFLTFFERNWKKLHKNDRKLAFFMQWIYWGDNIQNRGVCGVVEGVGRDRVWLLVVGVMVAG